MLATCWCIIQLLVKHCTKTLNNGIDLCYFFQETFNKIIRFIIESCSPFLRQLSELFKWLKMRHLSFTLITKLYVLLLLLSVFLNSFLISTSSDQFSRDVKHINGQDNNVADARFRIHTILELRFKKMFVVCFFTIEWKWILRCIAKFFLIELSS